MPATSMAIAFVSLFSSVHCHSHCFDEDGPTESRDGMYLEAFFFSMWKFHAMW